MKANYKAPEMGISRLEAKDLTLFTPTSIGKIDGEDTDPADAE